MITIIDSKGNKYNLNIREHGLQCLSFNVDAPSPIHEQEYIEGQDGYIPMGTTIDGRTMRASFFVESFDYLDFQLVRNWIFKLFDGRTQFYIIDNREPAKRWLVQTAQSYRIDRLTHVGGHFDIEFTSPSPYAESIGSTLDPKTFDVGMWQVGQGLTIDETKYTHTTKTFQIYNAGDVTIDPKKHPLVIQFKGQSLDLSIKNLSTGDEWKYTGSSAPLEVIKLDGVRSLKSNVSIFGNTNHKLITIQPGWNDFEITGPIGFDGFEISFSFKFYYL